MEIQTLFVSCVFFFAVSIFSAHVGVQERKNVVRPGLRSFGGGEAAHAERLGLGDDVVILTPDTFNRKLTSYTNSLVDFFTPW